jgi:sugar phosphate isomerase/epimerase
MPRFSFYIIPFKDEPLARSIERLARLGYDALEMPGEPANYDLAEVRGLIAGNGLKVSAVCGRLTGPERDLTTAEAHHRAQAVDYFRGLVDMAAALGAPAIVIGATAVRRAMPESAPEREWEWAVEGIARIADSAAGSAVKIAIEPWNRYETHLVNRIEQALRLRADAGRDNVGVMGDLFHMNIEESDIGAALRAAGPHLLNIHCADSNRRAPGHGHIDLVPAMAALQAIAYRHYVSVEFLPPRFIFEHGAPPEFYDPYPAETIAALRHAWKAAAAGQGGAP